jgi:DNA-binding Xre family transcriptional regulator
MYLCKYERGVDNMGMSERIKIMLVKRQLSANDLAKLLNCTPTNIYNKFKRDNFSEKELSEISDKLNCDFVGRFKMRDTGEEI